MSAKLMGQVWDLQLDHNHQLILLALADHASDDGGSIYPGIEYLEWKTGYSKRQIQRIISDLENMEILVSTDSHSAHRGHKLEWKLQLGKGVKKSPYTRRKGCQNVTDKKGDVLSKGDISGSERVTSGAIKGDISESLHNSTRGRGTIIEPSIETSSTTTYAQEQNNFDDPISKFPMITEAVFDALGTRFRSRYQMGTVTANRKAEVQKLVGMLAHEKRTIEEIYLFKTNWPKFLNNPNATEPMPSQMLDKFDQVVNFKPREERYAKPKLNARQQHDSDVVQGLIARKRANAGQVV